MIFVVYHIFIKQNIAYSTLLDVRTTVKWVTYCYFWLSMYSSILNRVVFHYSWGLKTGLLLFFCSVLGGTKTPAPHLTHPKS